MSTMRLPLNRLRTAALAVSGIVVLGAALRAPQPDAPTGRIWPGAVNELDALRNSGQNASIAKQNIAMVAIQSKFQNPVNVIVFVTKSARVAVGDLTPGAVSDTLRLQTPTTVTADVTGGEVHIVSADGTALDVTAIFRDSPAIKAEGHHAHVMLMQGGIGVGAVEPDASKQGQTYFEFQVEKPVSQIPGFGAPVYPAALRAAQAEGEVVTQFVVNEYGNPELGTFKILKATNDLFASAVRTALPSMRFSAAEIRGREVRQIVQQTFQFKLNR